MRGQRVLRIKPSSWLTRNVTIFDDAGSAVAEIAFAWFREAGKATIGGSTFTMRRDGWTGPFVLERNGKTVASAEKPSPFHRHFMVEYAGKEYDLMAESAFFRRFVLCDGGNVIGWMAPDHAFTNKAHAAFPAEIPLPVQVFTIWLVLTLWHRAEKNN